MNESRSSLWSIVSRWWALLIVAASILGCAGDPNVALDASADAACQAETEAQLCAEAGLECGEHLVSDGCAEERNIICGTCALEMDCRGSQRSVCVAPVPSSEWFRPVSHQGSTAMSSAGKRGGKPVHFDRAGNLLVIGHFFGSADFGQGLLPGGDGTTLFAAKYASDGVLMWAKGFKNGSAGDQFGYAITSDTDGNLYLTGAFEGELGLGGPILTPQDSACADCQAIFVAKLSPAGEHLWSQSFGGSAPGQHRGSNIAFDAQSGDVIVTGSVTSALSFGGATLEPSDGDAFVARFDSDGNHRWSLLLGNDGAREEGRGLVADGQGIIVVGASQDVSPGDGQAAADDDAFITQLSAEGHLLWSRAIAGSGADSAESVALGPHGDIWVAGRFTGVVDFGNGPENGTGYGPGSRAFIAHYDRGGLLVAVRQYGGPGDAVAYGIDLTSAGEVVVVGSFDHTFYHHGTFSSAGSADAFVAVSESTPGWTRTFGGVSSDWMNGVAIASDGRIAVAGRYTGAVSFGGQVVAGAPAPLSSPVSAVLAPQ